MWGATCHPWDVVVARSPFFAVSEGEWLTLDNMGSYSLVVASGFNGLGFPRVHYIASAPGAPIVQLILEAMRVRSGYGHLERARQTAPSITPSTSHFSRRESFTAFLLHHICSSASTNISRLLLL
ncbi:hypothetical protein HPB48_001434 [Haemaphysalis longicornis]|uniref:Ornithine decarboxylase n=1 Tax=Haemaphysalis longicornis TaxID=44386 RepID=A0A9J6FF34_HAELO|nr:hypothetical protein HPB48_001434 [Haemaphysalis longicornis]